MFALDRVLRYEDIPGLDAVPNKVNQSLRSSFYPKCMLSGNCRNFLNHSGKCSLIADNGSRIGELIDRTQPVQTFHPSTQYGTSTMMLPSHTVHTAYQSVHHQTPSQQLQNQQLKAGGLAYNNQISTQYQYQQQQQRYQAQPIQSHQYQQQQAQRVQPKRRNEYDDDEEEDEFMDEPVRKKEKILIDIDFIQPYLPPVQKISKTEWI